MSTPFIVFSKRSCREIRSCIVESYGLIRQEYPFINALCIEVPEEKVPLIEKHRLVAMVARDGEVRKMSEMQKISNDSHHPQVSCLTRRSPCSDTGGFGITIAIIDTGVSPHYDLLKPQPRIIAFKDILHGKPFPYDDDGHGTHVAGIAAGNGYTTGGTTNGTAPLANIAAIKALDENGSGTTSDILAAMQWVSENKDKYNIRVLNLSLGVTAEPGNSPDPLVIGTAALVMQGLTVVTAAGNSGPKASTISSPGISPLVVTVGAYGPKGVAEFSSRGPVSSSIHKPDILAPGVDILSLSSKNCKNYSFQTGTSMACPYVSGVVACILSAYPKATPRQIKRILTGMAKPIRGAGRDSQGAGCL